MLAFALEQVLRLKSGYAGVIPAETQADRPGTLYTLKREIHLSENRVAEVRATRSELFTRYRTAGVRKRGRSANLYHSRQCGIVIKPRLDYSEPQTIPSSTL